MKLQELVTVAAASVGHLLVRVRGFLRRRLAGFPRRPLAPLIVVLAGFAAVFPCLLLGGGRRPCRPPCLVLGDSGEADKVSEPLKRMKFQKQFERDLDQSKSRTLSKSAVSQKLTRVEGRSALRGVG